MWRKVRKRNCTPDVGRHNFKLCYSLFCYSPGVHDLLASCRSPSPTMMRAIHTPQRAQPERALHVMGHDSCTHHPVHPLLVQHTPWPLGLLWKRERPIWREVSRQSRWIQARTRHFWRKKRRKTSPTRPYSSTSVAPNCKTRESEFLAWMRSDCRLINMHVGQHT